MPGSCNAWPKMAPVVRRRQGLISVCLNERPVGKGKERDMCVVSVFCISQLELQIFAIFQLPMAVNMSCRICQSSYSY